MTSFLIVDDSPVDRRLASNVLEKLEGAAVRQAANGLAALDQLAIAQPDVVVTDIQMPDMDGLQLVLEVRRKYPSIPVVLMTARGSEDLAGQALEAGAAGYASPRLVVHGGKRTRAADVVGDSLARHRQHDLALRSRSSAPHWHGVGRGVGQRLLAR
ncbi:MAG: hypothetical protein FD138_2309 [Planctomycetota bacterium]|nr:MAG: hypothetical protein FD138_2309 [Planctomycetota bacterium]